MNCFAIGYVVFFFSHWLFIRFTLFYFYLFRFILESNLSEFFFFLEVLLRFTESRNDVFFFFFKKIPVNISMLRIMGCSSNNGIVSKKNSVYFWEKALPEYGLPSFILAFFFPPLSPPHLHWKKTCFSYENRPRFLEQIVLF